MTVKASEWLAHEPEADCDLSGHITLSCRAEPKHENAGHTISVFILDAFAFKSCAPVVRQKCGNVP